jgi:hypothetical protein
VSDAVVFLTCVIVGFTIAGFAVVAQRLSWREARRRLDPHPDAVTIAQVRRTIEAAGGADALIRRALREADAAIERAHRAGAPFGSSDMVVPALDRARRDYGRTDDEVLDALRALTLAQEADDAATRRKAINAPFDEWLRTNGHRFMT